MSDEEHSEQDVAVSELERRKTMMLITKPTYYT